MSDGKQPSSYFVERERVEREAALIAECPAARLAHERLADLYAQQAQSQADVGTNHPEGEAVSHLVILPRG